MSLVTRCPACSTLFRVTPAQLQVRAGKVRCGRCMQVFDGFQALAAEQANAASEPGRVEAEAAAQGAAAVAGTGAAMPGATATREPPAPPRKPLAQRIREFWSARRAPPGQRLLRRPTAAALWTTACALLAAVLGAQAAYAYRSELAARYPVVKVVMTGICELAGCSVPLPQKPSLVRIEASDVHMIDPARPALIQLTATLRSYANYDLAYPALDLVLTNANEHALARRIFLPEEYLDETRDPQAGIPPNAELTLALDLDTGDLNAAGFRIDLLPAPAP